MEIKILHLEEGARQAQGLAVIIDVFRAFSLECYIMDKNADKIIPVKDVDAAYALKKDHPDYILVGERHGKMLPGFDYGNSPSQTEAADFTGKTVIHTTSAGTKGLTGAVNAQEVITGSLVNAKAVAGYIKKNNFARVSLVCMGLEARNPVEEDTLCAEYIKRLLEGKSICMPKEIARLKNTSGSKFFDKSQSDVFPERDFYLCTDLNKFDFILRLENSRYIRKVEYPPTHRQSG